MEDRSETVSIPNCEGLHASNSGAALLVRVDGKPKWIPQSCIHDDSEVYKAETKGKLVVYEWFAIRAGLVRSKPK